MWHHIGITYDESDLKMYFDGVLIDEDNTGGAVDWGSSGPWRANGNPVFTGEYINGIWHYDWRVSEVVGPQSYFQQIYASRYGTE